MRLISMKFIRDLSKLADCSVCYKCMQNPTECIKCQNVWCSECIQKNENKCPNKCVNASFTKPHRLFRSIMNEILVKCIKCQKKVKQVEYDNHVNLNLCNQIQSQSQTQDKSLQLQQQQNNKRSLKQALQNLPEEKLNKYQKNENKSIQKHQQLQQQNNIKKSYEDEINEIFSDDNQTVVGSPIQNNNKININNNNQINLNETLSDDNTNDSDNQQNTQPLFQVKQEKRYNLRQNNNNKNNSNFKKLNIQLYEYNEWISLDDSLNNELNFQLIKHLENNKNLTNLVIQIKNTVFDFSKFESYDKFVSLRILDDEDKTDDEEYKYNDFDNYNQFSNENNNNENDQEDVKTYYEEITKQKKNIKKFRIFNNETDFKKYVNVYFLSDSDRIDYDICDQSKILSQYFISPLSKNVQTDRSQIDLQKMQEFNGKKIRDVKFELSF